LALVPPAQAGPRGKAVVVASVAPCGRAYHRNRIEIDSLVLVQLIESVRRKLGITNRVLNILVPEEALDQPSVVPTVGQIVAASVPEHMRMDRQVVEPGGLAVLLQHEPNGGSIERSALLRQEQVVMR